MPISGNHRNNTDKKARNDVWLTPPRILDSLGEFDLDPCAAIGQPWLTAKQMLTEADDGLSRPWHGRVWLNPPYGRGAVIPWMRRMYEHRLGISLVFARTDTKWWHKFVVPAVQGYLFLNGRPTFHYSDGAEADNNCGGPMVLLAYSAQDAAILQDCGLKGQYLVPGKEAFR